MTTVPNFLYFHRENKNEHEQGSEVGFRLGVERKLIWPNIVKPLVCSKNGIRDAMRDSDSLPFEFNFKGK